MNTVMLRYFINHYVLLIQTMLLPLCCLLAFIFNSQLLCYSIFICQDTEKGETVRHNTGYSLCEYLHCPPVDFLLSF